MLKKILTHPFFIFPLTALFVLWPISTCFFTVKNDALTYYYPVRALISDALNNGELPLWTPYINFGYPLHADMQSGAWSPVAWLFSYLTHFSLAGFHAELIFYFSMAGIGFYYLCRNLGSSITAAIIFGMAYQCSGFMIDSVQFYACIGSACWIPFVFLFFRKTITDKKATDGIYTGFFLYLLFTGGYPSLFIVNAYLLLAYCLYIFFTTPGKKIFVQKIIFPLAVVATSFILLSLPAIISFAQHLPYIDRGKTQSLSFVLENSMPPAAFVSFISPFATTAVSGLLQTDPLMRNVYIGIVPLIFIGYGILNRQVKIKGDARFFLVTSLLMFAMALGSYFVLRQAAYYVLPLMNTFRHPAILRLFGLFFLLLFGAHAFTSWELNKDRKNILKTLLLLTAIIVTITIVLFFKNGTQVKSLLQVAKTESIKLLLQELSFTQRFLLQLPLLAIVMLTLLFVLKSSKALYLLPLVTLLDIFAATQINLPVTVVGAGRFKEVEENINRNKVAFPLPSLTATITENTNESYSFITGSKLHYTKKIGRNDYYITPGNLAAQEKFYESAVKDTVFEKPVLFVEQDSTANISIGKFGANNIELTVLNNRPGKLVYLQNIYPDWQVWVDGHKISIDTVYTTFMSVPLRAGKHRVLFQYKPAAVITAWYISAASFLLLILFFLRRRFFSKQQ